MRKKVPSYGAPTYAGHRSHRVPCCKLSVRSCGAVDPCVTALQSALRVTAYCVTAWLRHRVARCSREELRYSCVTALQHWLVPSSPPCRHEVIGSSHQLRQ
eukprot:355400-Prymnesium_polylepis.1